TTAAMAIFLGVPLLQVAGNVVVIKLANQLSLITMVTFCIGFLDALIINVIVATCASKINTRSKNVFYSWRKGIHFQYSPSKRNKVKVVLREIASFLPLRVEFGNNFV